MRLRRIMAIAERDLRQELKGRRGLMLPAVMAGLLLPTSLAPTMIRGQIGDDHILVSGDVPDRVLALPRVVQSPHRGLRFKEQGDHLQVLTDRVPRRVQQALDQPTSPVTTTYVEAPLSLPKRSWLLALLSASTLTGGLASSIGGERSQRTLGVLLSAAVTKREILIGKWLAWGGLGALASLLAAAVAVLYGSLSPGLWLIALPWVPLSTVAFGLWLVRRATDVIGGAAVSLRVLPAALMVTSLVAWGLGQYVSPWISALVPIGGALLAAGDTWGVPGQVLLATATTAVASAAWLWIAARDLDEQPQELGFTSPAPRALMAMAAGVLAWWLPVAGPVLWLTAGNAQLTDQLGVQPGALAGGALLLAWSLQQLTQAGASARHALGAPTPGWILAGGALGAALYATPPLHLTLPLPWMDLAQRRLALGLSPPWLGAGVIVAVADELLFRGWLLDRVGPRWSMAVWIVVKSPLDPLMGLLTGASLTGLRLRSGSLWAGLLARLTWLSLAALFAS